MKSVTHLIPYDGIGGVETAARSMVGVNHDKVDFKVEYIYAVANLNSQSKAVSMGLQTLKSISRIVSRKPDLLIVSLWRSCIIGIIVKMLRPDLKLVLFLHSTKNAHWLDAIITRMTSVLAVEVWADSEETLTRRLQVRSGKRGRVISFITHHVSSLAGKPVAPFFVFWGRIHPHKKLDRALAIFSAVVSRLPEARFTIIGPDGGKLSMLKQRVSDFGLSESVQFLGGMNFLDISGHANKASFYLQTSEREGMAMSVVEAMQLGLIPVVTPVGQIGHYCIHGENSLVIDSDKIAVSDILTLLSDDARYQLMRDKAVLTWSAGLLYADSMLESSVGVLEIE